MAAKPKKPEEVAVEDEAVLEEEAEADTPVKPVKTPTHMMVFIKKNDLNEEDTHISGSINGVKYTYPRGEVVKVKYAEGLEMCLIGQANKVE